MKYSHFVETEDLGYSLKEEILEYDDRRVLYLTSELSEESFSIGCGGGAVGVSRSDTRTAYVKGCVVRWKCEKDEKGLDISELEPIDSREQETIRQLVQSRCNVKFVYFQ